MDEELRSRIRIRYVDSYGEVEAGVDGGGLFKDFMENLVKEGFNPEVGLFRTTPEQKLYPNPAAGSAVPNALVLFEFLGKMLGKAMYEVSIWLDFSLVYLRCKHICQELAVSQRSDVQIGCKSALPPWPCIHAN